MSNSKVCPTCQAESLAIDRNGNEICRNCEKTLKIYKKINRNETRCPACSSANYEKKGFRRERQRYVCKDCGRNWTSEEVIKGLISTNIKNEYSFQTENTLEEVITYLKNQAKNNKPLSFWYRNDVEPRKIYNYFIDEKYVQVRSDKGHYIKFLIDKIRKI